MLSNQVEMLHKHVKRQATTAAHNEDLMDIYEGDLLRFVEAALKQQISVESYNMASKRIPPINILIKLIDKLSKIYQQEPVRHVSAGRDTDSELLSFYEKSMGTNSKLNTSNEYLNLFKNTLIQPYVDGGLPKLRAIPSHSFTVFSESEVDPLVPTHVITYHSCYEDGRNKSLYHCYTDNEFMIFDDEGKTRVDMMARYDLEDGINIAGKIPFVYVNKSNNLLIPKIDSDVKAMTILLPVMLADLNFANMMQAFSIIYGIDIDNTGIKMSPNAFWNFKSDQSTDKTPQIGVLKPSVDVDQSLRLIQAQVALWLQTKGLKPGAVGELTVENAASGISKMIDEVDTSEERQKQATLYEKVEEQLWKLITEHLHPLWRGQSKVDTTLDFSKGVEIGVSFTQQLPMVSRGDIVGDMKAEIDAGFISKRRAIKKLNPRMSDAEIDELTQEMSIERGEGGETGGRETLSGIQITSIVNVVKDVAAGLLPRDGGINIIMTSFGLTYEQAEPLFGDSSFKLSVSEVQPTGGGF